MERKGILRKVIVALAIVGIWCFLVSLRMNFEKDSLAKSFVWLQYYAYTALLGVLIGIITLWNVMRRKNKSHVGFISILSAILNVFLGVYSLYFAFKEGITLAGSVLLMINFLIGFLVTKHIFTIVSLNTDGLRTT